MMDLGGTGNKLLPEPMMGKYTDWCIPHPLWFNSHYTDQAMIVSPVVSIVVCSVKTYSTFSAKKFDHYDLLIVHVCRG